MSGQELCERFGVSRTAIWKNIEQLKRDGYQIDAVKNRGYLLKESAPCVFGRTEIESRRKTKWIGQTTHYYDSIDSTNSQAKRLAEEGALDGTVVVADRQTAGRGRRGRGWMSPAGKNLYFTILLRPKLAPDKASMLTLVMALAVARGIQKTTPSTAKQIGIKWPNDIVINGRKVCGILTEMSLSVEQNCIDHLAIGVGINVARQSFPEEIKERAVALDEICDDVNRSELLANILQEFEQVYARFMETEDLQDLLSAYHAMLVNMDRYVRVLDPKGEYDGIARGIKSTGELIVELPDGTRRDVYAGEVSVRGIYGYA